MKRHLKAEFPKGTWTQKRKGNWQFQLQFRVGQWHLFCSPMPRWRNAAQAKSNAMRQKEKNACNGAFFSPAAGPPANVNSLSTSFSGCHNTSSSIVESTEHGELQEVAALKMRKVWQCGGSHSNSANTSHKRASCSSSKERTLDVSSNLNRAKASMQ